MQRCEGAIQKKASRVVEKQSNSNRPPLISGNLIASGGSSDSATRAFRNLLQKDGGNQILSVAHT